MRQIQNVKSALWKHCGTFFLLLFWEHNARNQIKWHTKCSFSPHFRRRATASWCSATPPPSMADELLSILASTDRRQSRPLEMATTPVCISFACLMKCYPRCCCDYVACDKQNARSPDVTYNCWRMARVTSGRRAERRRDKGGRDTLVVRPYAPAMRSRNNFIKL